MGLVDYDVESESFRATYDSSSDSTCLAVVAVVSTALGKEPLDLTPLQSAIETDALDELVTESSSGIKPCDSISFRYEGFEITVTSGEIIEASPLENT